MANVIKIKRGQKSNIGETELAEGELAVAYTDDGKTAAELYVGNGKGKVQINLKGEKGDAGARGIDGAKGDAGPNEVSADTATNFNGLLKGDGANVAQASKGTDYLAPDSIIDGGTF